MKPNFIKLYDRYFDSIYRYVYFKTGSYWETDDLVSDIFRKAFEKYPSQTKIQNHKAWLMTIARNTVIDFYRRKKDTITDQPFELIDEGMNIADKVAQKEELDCLQKALSSLSSEDQELITMKYFSDMKYREIGDVLEKSENAVKTQGFRLLKKLNLLVNNCMGVVK